MKKKMTIMMMIFLMILMISFKTDYSFKDIKRGEIYGSITKY